MDFYDILFFQKVNHLRMHTPLEKEWSCNLSKILIYSSLLQTTQKGEHKSPCMGGGVFTPTLKWE
jgi:hypothetical protein